MKCSWYAWASASFSVVWINSSEMEKRLYGWLFRQCNWFVIVVADGSDGTIIIPSHPRRAIKRKTSKSKNRLFLLCLSRMSFPYWLCILIPGVPGHGGRSAAKLCASIAIVKINVNKSNGAKQRERESKKGRCQYTQNGFRNCALLTI